MATLPQLIPFTVADADQSTTRTSDGPRPLLTVLLDDGSDTFPYDVTRFVNLRAGVSITRGRPDERQSVEASTLRLQLDNTDGRFTAGGTSPYAVYVDQKIRVTATKGSRTSVRFTGFVQSWPTQWDTPTGSYAIAQVTATDRFPRLARHILRPVQVEETLLDEPIAFWPMWEEDGATSAGDVSGNRQGTLAAVGDESERVDGEKKDLRVHFGDDHESRQLETGVRLVNGGQVLRGRLNKALTSEALTLSFFLRTGAKPTTNAKVLDLDFLTVNVDALGVVLVQCVGVADTYSEYAVNDGDPHHVAVRVSSSGTVVRKVDVFIDGQPPLITGKGRDREDPERARVLQVGGHDFTGTVSHLALWDTSLDDATIKRHSDLALANITAKETPGARLARLASYAGISRTATATSAIPQTLPFTIGAGEPGLAVEVMTTRRVAFQQLGGKDMLSSARELEAAEDGLLFVSGTGAITLFNRRHRVFRAAGTPQVTVSVDKLIGRDLTFVNDPQFLINQASGSSWRGGVQTIRDQRSVDRHELYPAELGELLVDSDRDVQSRLRFLVATYKEPIPRASAVPLDLLTVDVPTQQAAMGLELLDLVRVTNLPTQAPSTSVDLLVEGWQEEFTDASWSMTLNTSPAAPSRAWVLGQGTLGGTARLGY
jgi:hypothetical protein